MSEKDIKKLAVKVLIGVMTIEEVREAYGDEIADKVIAIIEGKNKK